MKTLAKSIILLFVGSLFVFSSCDDGDYDGKRALPAHTGEIGEVLVVIDKVHWEGMLVKSIRDSLEKLNYSLPQPEPFMNVKLVTDKSFSANYKTHHTILYIDLMPNSANLVGYLEGPKKDVHANDQAIYKIYAKTVEEAYNVYMSNYYVLEAAFDARVRDLAIKEVSKTKNAAVNEELGLTLKINAAVPQGFTVSGNFGDMIWLSQLRMRYADGNDHEVQLGLLFYSYPYIDSATFSQDWLLNKRDSITKKYIKSDVENSYMATERSEGLAYKEFTYNGRYTIEIRGLWKVENALMGGPFMSVSFYDEPNKRVVTIDGYVFAPYFRKMEYMRELEAIIYSYSLL